jgi:hypothetical protein
VKAISIVRLKRHVLAEHAGRRTRLVPEVTWNHFYLVPQLRQIERQRLGCYGVLRLFEEFTEQFRLGLP